MDNIERIFERKALFKNKVKRKKNIFELSITYNKILQKSSKID